MGTQQKRTAVLVLGSMILAGCATDQGAQSGDDMVMGTGSGVDGTGGDGTGTGTGGTGSDGTGGGGGGGTNPTDPGATTGPTYPTTHPRIYLTPNRARLMSALNSRTPAAMRFK